MLVSLMAQKAEVKYDPAYIMPSQIANHMSEIGYHSTLIENETVGQNTIELKVRIVESIAKYKFCKATSVSCKGYFKEIVATVVQL